MERYFGTPKRRGVRLDAESPFLINYEKSKDKKEEEEEPWYIRFVRFVQKNKETFWATPIFSFSLVIAIAIFVMANIQFHAHYLILTLAFFVVLYMLFSTFGFPYPYEFTDEGGWVNMLNKPIFYDDMGEFEVQVSFFFFGIHIKYYFKIFSDPIAPIVIMVSRNTGNFLYACTGISIFASIWTLFAVGLISLQGALCGSVAYLLAIVTFIIYLTRYNFSFKDEFGEPIDLENVNNINQ